MEELVLNALIENNNKYCVYGLRTDDRVFNVGDELGCSRDLYWENYDGAHMYLIAGDDSEYGNDPAEIIIRNAVVVAVIK